MDILEKIRNLKESRSYDLEKVNDIVFEIEEIISPTDCWRVVKSLLPTDELLDTLEDIAKEYDI